MKTKGKIITLLLSMLMACALGFMVTFTVNSYAADVVEFNASGVSMTYESSYGSWLYSRAENQFQAYICLNNDVDGNEIDIKNNAWDMITGVNAGAQEYFYLNGVSAKTINSGNYIDYSGWAWNIHPTGSYNAAYEKPIMFYIEASLDQVYVIIHSELISHFDGKLEITLKEGFSYIDGDVAEYKFVGNDVTFKFVGGQWYKSNALPETIELNLYSHETNLTIVRETAAHRIWLKLDANASLPSIGYHITERTKKWNYLSNFIRLNGRTIANINASIDDSTWDYTGSNYVVASSDPASGYCKPVFVLQSGANFVIYIHDNYLAQMGDDYVFEILPCCGFVNGTTIYNASTIKRAVSLVDVNSSSSCGTSTGNGIDVENKIVETVDADSEYYFDLNFSANIMLDNHYTGPVTFNYFGDIWKNFVYVTSTGIDNASVSTLTAYARMEVASGTTFADKTKVRIYLKDTVSAIDTSITLKKGMPFSSGEVLSKDYVISFVSLETTDGNGKTVVGWNDGTSTVSGGKVVAKILASGETTTLNPVYGITYNLDGGVNANVNPNSYVFGESVNITDPTKTGYSFVKWTANEEDFTGITESTAGAIELTAVWEIENYTITYLNMEDASNAQSNPSSYNVESETITLASPEKSGYRFTGWKLNDENGNAVTQIVKGSTGDLILYATWTIETYYIEYELDGGVNDDNNPLSYQPTTEVTLANPTKLGYDFNGWRLNSIDGEIVTKIELGSTEDVVLYATWSLTVYEINYVLDGGTNANVNPTTYTMESDDIIFAAPEKAGYVFVEWQINGEFAVGIEKGSVGDVTVTAVWELDTTPAPDNTPNDTPENPETSTGGCGSNVTGNVVLSLIVTLVATTFIVVKRKFRND